jgi:ligand-binding sensor domain-containing protein
MIHSDQVHDVISTLDGKGVLFGTSFGLSLYNGTWSTRHINRDNISAGLMDEFITAIEFDHTDRLWIGYSGGIQIYDGTWYQTIRDQQLLKDRRIQDLQRWNNDMWVATGNSGVHRYRDGVWTWFQPMTPTGPGFYEIREMVLDPGSDTLLIATADNGLWIVRSPEDPVVFEQIAPKYGTYGRMDHVKRDRLGGVYFFNDTSVVHYSPRGGFVPVLTIRDLTMKAIEINDLAVHTDGTLILATDDGIFFWRDGGIYRRITRFDGIGTSEIVRMVAVDAQGRVWFATPGYVGYYQERSGAQNLIRIDPVITDTPLMPAEPTPLPTPVIIRESPAEETGQNSPAGPLGPILDPIFRALNTILSRLGIQSA